MQLRVEQVVQVHRITVDVIDAEERKDLIDKLPACKLWVVTLIHGGISDDGRKYLGYSFFLVNP